MSDGWTIEDFAPVARPHWEALRDRGELLFQRCTACGEPRLPSREECPTCLSPDAEWEVATGSGTIVSWVVYHHAYDPALADRVPYAVALVQLDEGPRLLTNVSGEPLAAGARVQLAVEHEGALALARFELE
jgi:uncharacterized OB-fold protein